MNSGKSSGEKAGNAAEKRREKDYPGVLGSGRVQAGQSSWSHVLGTSQNPWIEQPLLVAILSAWPVSVLLVVVVLWEVGLGLWPLCSFAWSVGQCVVVSLSDTYSSHQARLAPVGWSSGHSQLPCLIGRKSRCFHGITKTWPLVSS